VPPVPHQLQLDLVAGAHRADLVCQVVAAREPASVDRDDHVAAGAQALRLELDLVVAGLDAGDQPPSSAALADWSGVAGVRVRSCAETEHRLPARDPVQVYLCDLVVGGRAVQTCVAVDRREVVAAGAQLSVVAGCPAGDPFGRRS
jgi:hypothetical protein